MIDSPRYLLSFDTRSLEKVSCDVLVIGSGISGLFVAKKLSEHFHVTLACKQKISEGSSRYAQGGVAVALEGGKTESLHVKDTLNTGLGLCDEKKVRFFVREGRERIFDLEKYGVTFDKENGEFHLAREAAHSEPRILHVKGDATGEGIEHVLADSVRKSPRVSLLEQYYAVDILTKGGACYGALLFDIKKKKLFVFYARLCVIATGGAGHIYKYTTNPETATGDGVSMAYRAGAQVTDMEFFQFHPTAYYTKKGRNFLMTEALRGEGALIRNHEGARFLTKIHPLAELAPRDVVSAALCEEMKRTRKPYMYLDVTKIPRVHFKKRFPRINKWCLSHGLNTAKDWIPIAPSAHYMIGGIKTGNYSETNVKNLYAVGESACTYIHGANRLASNSLLECLVFSHRAAVHAKKILNLSKTSVVCPDFSNESYPGTRKKNALMPVKHLKQLMWDNVGIMRDEQRLVYAKEMLARGLKGVRISSSPSVAHFELCNMLMVSYLIANGAQARKESRGCHVRKDYQKKNDRIFKKHFIFTT